MGIKKIKIKKVSPKQFAGAMKTVGKALYKYTGAETMVTSGKALSKCKPKDSKCIAMNLGKVALSAKNFIPGAGMAAGIASTVAKNVIKEQVQKKVKAELAKKGAQKKLKAAASVGQKKKAQAAIAKASATIAAAAAASVVQKKKAQAAIAKASATIAAAAAAITVKKTQKAQAEIVIKQQAAAEKAIQVVKKAKLDPKTAAAAKITEKEIEEEIKNVPSVAAVEKATGVAAVKKATGVAAVKKTDKSKPLKYILGLLLAVLAFVFFFM